MTFGAKKQDEFFFRNADLSDDVIAAIYRA
jgi:hypothetical protein